MKKGKPDKKNKKDNYYKKYNNTIKNCNKKKHNKTVKKLMKYYLNNF